MPLDQERDDRGRFAGPNGAEPTPADAREPAAPKNYFREAKDGFDIDLPTGPIALPDPDGGGPIELDTHTPATPDSSVTPPSGAQDAQVAPAAADPAKQAATRALAEMLGWREPPAGRSTTNNGEAWLTAEQWVEKFNPKKTYDELQALKSDVNRQVADGIGRELDGVRGQINRTVGLQRQKIVTDWRKWIAAAPNAEESLRRQTGASEALREFDRQFAPAPQQRASSPSPSGAPAPSAAPAAPPQPYVEAYQGFAQRNAAWFDPTKRGGVRAMTVFAQDVTRDVANDPRFSGNPVAEFAEIERRVRSEFKDHALFRGGDGALEPQGHPGGGAQRAPDIQGAPRRGAAGPQGKGWSSLPEGARQMFTKVHVPFGSFKDTPADRERYAAQIHADSSKKKGFDIQ